MRKLFSVLILLCSLLVAARILWPGGPPPVWRGDAAQLRMTAEHLAEEGLAAVRQLAGELGNLNAEALFTRLSPYLSRTAQYSDEALRAELDRLASSCGLTLSDRQRDTLLRLCRSLEGLDADALRRRSEQLREALRDASEVKDKAVGLFDRARDLLDAGRDLIGGGAPRSEG